MTWNDFLIWPDQAALSLLVLFILALPILYAAREPAHRAVRGLTRLLAGQLRAGSRWLRIGARDLRRRNREVVLEEGKEEIEGRLESEYQRLTAIVERELHDCPDLQRRLSELTTKLEEDYRTSLAEPPAPPEWTEALESVAKLKSPGDARMERILKDVRDTVTAMHKEATSEYRQAMRKRYEVLKGSREAWRSADTTLTKLDQRVTSLQQAASAIDTQMERYEALRRDESPAERRLGFSASSQLAISSIALLVAIGGAVINFQLIALPMSEMVGGSAYLGEFRMADVAALVIILVEATLGLFLMELLGVTHLFPRLRVLERPLRRRLLYMVFGFLFSLAAVEVALAYLRDRIAASNLALRQTLTLSEEVEAASWWIPTAGQMVLGFILPFVLAFVAVPLEVFIHSARTVLGALAATVLAGLGFVARLLANLFHHLGEILVAVYDAVIGIPILVEKLVRDRRERPPRAPDEPEKTSEEPERPEKERPRRSRRIATQEQEA